MAYLIPTLIPIVFIIYWQLTYHRKYIRDALKFKDGKKIGAFAWMYHLTPVFGIIGMVLISNNAHAGCFSDQYGNQTCISQPQGQTDFRNDYNSPKIYENGQYRGNLNNNQYDPNSISNPYSKYGSPYSNESINNPYRSRW